jgi:hypothetical protein
MSVLYLSALDRVYFLRSSFVFLHIKKKNKTKKAFWSFQVRIQMQNKTLLVSFLFLFKKQFHMRFIFRY